MIVKRLFDIIVASILAFLFAPIIMIIALLVWHKLGSPILFRQTRPGLHGRPFEMIKFRTMRNDYDEDGAPLSDAQRLTRFGKLLRATSLDELPELWNVIKGEMSLVGPRPLLMEYLPLYSPKQSRRHEVRPGLTGWAQVNGRNSLSWEERFELDLFYVDNRTLLLDIKIIWLTIRSVLSREGVNTKEGLTMPLFRGEEATRKEE